MKKLLTLGIVFSLGLSAVAEEKKTPVVPPRKDGTKQLQKQITDEVRAANRKAKKLDVATYLRLQHYLESQEDESIRNRQLTVGTLASAAGAYGFWKSYQGRTADATTGKLVSTPRARILRGASVVLFAAGVVELGVGVRSHALISDRDKAIRAKIDDMVGTPLEQAILYQLGQEATDEMLADMIASGVTSKAMAITWIVPADLLFLDEKTEIAKKKYLGALGEKNGRVYIESAEKRDAVAEYYGRRQALLELQLRDESAEDMEAYKQLFEEQLKQHLAEIERDLELFNK